MLSYHHQTLLKQLVAIAMDAIGLGTLFHLPFWFFLLLFQNSSGCKTQIEDEFQDEYRSLLGTEYRVYSCLCSISTSDHFRIKWLRKLGCGNMASILRRPTDRPPDKWRSHNQHVKPNGPRPNAINHSNSRQLRHSSHRINDQQLHPRYRRSPKLDHVPNDRAIQTRQRLHQSQHALLWPKPLCRPTK